MAQKLRKDLANGEVKRLGEYNGMMNGIKGAIRDIRKDVMNIQKSTTGMLDDLFKNRDQASDTWMKMQANMAQIRKNGNGTPHKETVTKPERKEEKIEIPSKTMKETHVKADKKTKIGETIKTAAKTVSEPVMQSTTEEKVLDFINKHPKGVRISDMEEPLGETRMKIGFIAKNLLEEGKVLKIDTVFYPKIKHEG